MTFGCDGHVENTGLLQKKDKKTKRQKKKKTESRFPNLINQTRRSKSCYFVASQRGCPAKCARAPLEKWSKQTEESSQTVKHPLWRVRGVEVEDLETFCLSVQSLLIKLSRLFSHTVRSYSEFYGREFLHCDGPWNAAFTELGQKNSLIS